MFCFLKHIFTIITQYYEKKSVNHAFMDRTSLGELIIFKETRQSQGPVPEGNHR